MYLETFKFPDDGQEFDFILGIKRKCYDTFYPFKILSRHRFEQIDFEPITILYGGNGSGKSTALNVIAEKLELRRESRYNQSNFFGEYVKLCSAKASSVIPTESRIITSDDVFDYMLDIRTLNEGIDRKREDMFDEYLEAKYSDFKLKSINDFERLRQVNQARSKTQSQYVRRNLMDNVREFSNGESALTYFMEKIGENGLYLLDEPENSLSAERQQELVSFLQDSARFFGCQFVISTHSPFFLAMKGAKIYDLDEDPVDVKRWTELGNVQTYWKFFREHREEFGE